MKASEARLREHREGVRDDGSEARTGPAVARKDIHGYEATNSDGLALRRQAQKVRGELREGAACDGVHLIVDTAPALPAGRRAPQQGLLRPVSSVPTTDACEDGDVMRRVDDGPRPAAIVRRRITGKRKLEQAGGAGSRSPEFEGPTSKLRCDAGDLHGVPAWAMSGTTLGDLDHGEEGPTMHQARWGDGIAPHSSARRRRSTEAWGGGNSEFVNNELHTDDAANGELNTLKYTSLSSATASTGGLSHDRASGEFAASHSLTGVGSGGAESG